MSRNTKFIYVIAECRVQRDVLNLVPVHFVATVLVRLQFCFIWLMYSMICSQAGLPLKTDQNPHGIYMERELLQMLRDIFGYIFLDADPEKRMRAKEVAKSHVQELLGHIKSHLKKFTNNGVQSLLFLFM
jgi:linoleate 10R-lipoxygenase